ncbi:hypothetical protein acdb102_48110 [Acidothermaceae bacterium B102]|nr:hypothetical protein acdb102_48110 [Acidothermaceae bacterium B102]
MTQSGTRLVQLGWWVVLATLAVGWSTSLEAFVEGPATGADAPVLLGLSVIATAGAVVAAAARRRGQHWLVALALVLVALSPTVFVYPLNLAVLGLAFAELAAALGCCGSPSPGSR